MQSEFSTETKTYPAANCENDCSLVVNIQFGNHCSCVCSRWLLHDTYSHRKHVKQLCVCACVCI